MNNTTTGTKSTKRGEFIATKTAELVAKGWKAATAEKYAAKCWRLQSPQHIAAEKRNRDLARARYAEHVDGAMMDAAQVAIAGHLD